jgi:hypothetical protein
MGYCMTPEREEIESVAKAFSEALMANPGYQPSDIRIPVCMDRKWSYQDIDPRIAKEHVGGGIDSIHVAPPVYVHTGETHTTIVMMPISIPNEKVSEIVSSPEELQEHWRSNFEARLAMHVVPRGTPEERRVDGGPSWVL